MNHKYNNQSTKKKRRELRKNPTDAERKVWNILKGEQMGARFFRQYSVDLYVLDFYCPARRIAIEIDGGQHAEEKHKQHDEKRSNFLTRQNIYVLRFWNNEVIQNLEGVWQKIKDEISKHSSP